MTSEPVQQKHDKALAAWLYAFAAVVGALWFFVIDSDVLGGIAMVAFFAAIIAGALYTFRAYWSVRPR